DGLKTHWFSQVLSEIIISLQVFLYNFFHISIFQHSLVKISIQCTYTSFFGCQTFVLQSFFQLLFLISDRSQFVDLASGFLAVFVRMFESSINICPSVMCKMNNTYITFRFASDALAIAERSLSGESGLTCSTFSERRGLRIPFHQD